MPGSDFQVKPHTYRKFDMDFIKKRIVNGYGWVYGVHGIGKTSLADRCASELDDYDIQYIDSRTEVHSFPNLTCCLLSKLGKDYKNDEYEDYRLLRSLFEKEPPSKLRFVIDELDVYSPLIVRPVWHLPKRNIGLIFISARSTNYFDDDLCSRDISNELQLRALPRDIVDNFFRRRQISDDDVDSLITLSGGNPSLLNFLSQMYEETNNADVLSNANSHFLSLIFSYFEKVWDSLEEQLRTRCLFASIISYNYLNNTRHWTKLGGYTTPSYLRKLSRRLRGMIAFGEQFPERLDDNDRKLPAIISPLFLTWVLMEKVFVIDDELIFGFSEEKSLKIGKYQVSWKPSQDMWRDAGKAALALGSFAKAFRTILSLF